MKRLAHHPAAGLFPMLSESELVALREKFVAQRAQLVPIVTLEGKILDGRNREEICHRLGWAPKTITWSEWLEQNDVSMVPPPSPVEWVLAINLDRRHLNESQRAMVGADALPLLEAEAARRQKAGKKIPAAAEAPEPTLAPRGAKVPSVGRPGSPAKGKASQIAAKAVGASSRSVERAKEVLTKRPELAEQIRAAKISLGQAVKAITREAQVKKVREYRPPKGEFSVIVTDPPWRFDDQLDGSDQARGGCPYPPMETDAICAIKMPMAADCIVFLFVTNTHLINGDASRVLNAWGVKGMTMATWPKTSIKTGWWLRGQTEHVIMAARGKPVRTLTNQSTLLPAWPSGAHSEKPEEFFPWVESLCPSPDRLEMFSRVEKREGWTVAGAEAGAASPKAGNKRRDNMRFVDAKEAS